MTLKELRFFLALCHEPHGFLTTIAHREQQIDGVLCVVNALAKLDEPQVSLRGGQKLGDLLARAGASSPLVFSNILTVLS